MRRRPSASIAISLIALVLAASGSAIAATKLVSGDELIKKHTLSGDRLRDHAISGRQVNLGKLGKVPSARNADHANVATAAVHAFNAANAVNASNASTLGGQPAGAFEPAANFIRTGLVKADPGQTVPLASFGPFTLSLRCNDDGAGNVDGEIEATSAEAGSDGYGVAMAIAGQSYSIIDTSTGTAFAESDDNAADFLTPSGRSYIADLTVGRHYLGAGCFASALISPS